MTLQAESTDVLTAVSVSAIVFFLLLLSLTAAIVSTLALGRKKLKKPQDTEAKGDSTCNAKKVHVVPNHAYASVNVSRHVKVPVYPNAAYAVCKPVKSKSVKVNMLPNKANVPTNTTVSGCTKILVHPNEVYALSKRVEAPVYELVT